jgi:hypothetical protein
VCELFLGVRFFLGENLLLGGEGESWGRCLWVLGGGIYVERGRDPQDLCGRTVLQTVNNKFSM